MRPFAMRWRLSAWLVAGCAVAVLAGCGSPVLPGDRTAARRWGEAREMCRITDRRVRESSGVTAGRRATDSFFTHNDSGNGEEIFRFNRQGKVTGVWRVRGVTNRDWEDLGSFERDGKPWLVIADIGDNRARRTTIELLTFLEPNDPRYPLGQVQRYAFKYPDKPHNAEALLMHPTTGEFHVVTKTGSAPAGVYAGELGTPGRTQTLRKIGEIELTGFLAEAKRITGGAVSPDGQHVALRTYLGAYEFDVDRKFANWLKSSPRKVPLKFDLQGEGITYRADGKGLVTSAELVPCVVNEILLENP
ncbi:MAG: hypothetical protein SFX74_01410 [Fimbriimonadaceae bacterium]|nr:hypothetical protein [Fimbriimonadaceae bacterium]